MNYVAIDLETTGLNPHTDTIVDIYYSFDGEVYTRRPLDQLDRCALDWKNATLIFHNGKFDLHFLYKAGLDLTKHKWYDTLLLHHLLNENKPHDLDTLIKEYFNDAYKEIFWSKYKTYEEAPHGERVEYGGKDVIYTYRLFHEIQRQLQNDPIPNELIHHTHRLASSLLLTEIEGLPIDLEYVQECGVGLKQKIADLKKTMSEVVADEIYAIETDTWLEEIGKRKTEKGKSGVPRPAFSFDSNKQLANLLYGYLRLPKQTNDKTKSITVDDAALKKIENRHPLVPLIREYREHTKIFGTYIEGVLERQINGVVYPSFNVAGTATGRISHSNPNMGNMPSTGGIRKMFVARPGHKIISADYSQLEICLAAHFSQDPALLDIVKNGKSQHDITAEALGIERQKAKTLNFAEQYGCSAFKIAKILGVKLEKAQELHNLYWNTYAGQKHLIEECNKKVDNGDPIVSPFGRKRRFTKVVKRPVWDSAYRQSYNALIQGTGADLTSRAFYLISEELRKDGRGRGLFTVHDEVLIEVGISHLEHYRRRLKDIMVGLGEELKLTVPLSVEVSEGSDRWED